VIWINHGHDYAGHESDDYGHHGGMVIGQAMTVVKSDGHHGGMVIGQE
jgi:hypothetical protein